MVYVHKIFETIWDRDVPSDWAQVFVVLVSESDTLDDPAEFRPIAINTGEDIFSVVSDRLQNVMLENKYIRRAVRTVLFSAYNAGIQYNQHFC
jgi:hypothetical protein